MIRLKIQDFTVNIMLICLLEGGNDNEYYW